MKKAFMYSMYMVLLFCEIQICEMLRMTDYSRESYQGHPEFLLICTQLTNTFKGLFINILMDDYLNVAFFHLKISRPFWALWHVRFLLRRNLLKKKVRRIFLLKKRVRWFFLVRRKWEEIFLVWRMFKGNNSLTKLKQETLNNHSCMYSLLNVILF
jgi:hypothetical protein